jgi:hypothetical protein
VLTWRAVVTAFLPGIITFLVFFQWHRLSFAASLAAGIIWTLASLVVTRILYDDAAGDLEAWRAEAPDLAVPGGTSTAVDVIDDGG